VSLMKTKLDETDLVRSRRNLQFLALCVIAQPAPAGSLDCERGSIELCKV
jgi:hypothetical protein